MIVVASGYGKGAHVRELVESDGTGNAPIQLSLRDLSVCKT